MTRKWVLMAWWAAVVTAAAQTASFEGVLSGRDIPLTLQLKDLDGGWRRFQPASGPDPAGAAAVYRALSGAGPVGGVFYTRGQTITVGDETYLVAYRIAPRPVDAAQFNLMMRGGAPPPEPEKPTATTPLRLALLHLRSLGSFLDVRPFNLDVELGGEPEEPAGDPAAEASLKNLRQLGVALLSYASERRVLPALTDAAMAREELVLYVRNKEVFEHPTTRKAYLPNPSLSGKKPTDIERPDRTVVFYEATPAADGLRGVLFLDGRAERITEAQWNKLRESSAIP